MPASLGEMCFQTPMLPWRMLWPAASSMKNSGTPTISRRITYSSMKAPGGTGGIDPFILFIYFLRKKKGTIKDYSGLQTVGLHWETLTSSVLVAEVRKPPDVAQADAESHLGQHVLDLRVPRWTVLIGRLGSVSAGGSGQLAFRPALCQPAAALRAVERWFLSLGGNKDQEWLKSRRDSTICFAKE